jgi:hypothetical protein
MIEGQTEPSKLWQKPGDPTVEPIANFPLPYYKYFLAEIRRLGVEVITYADIFSDADDWDYQSFYPNEYKNWLVSRDPEKTYLLIQHDVDNHPFFAKRMVALEMAYGIRSNVFIFKERYVKGKSGAEVAYDVDHDFFHEAQRMGFVIGYHQNAFALENFDMGKAVKRYADDVEFLRKHYDIRFVTPHGGAGLKLAEKTIGNVDVPIPEKLEGNLRWVYNRFGVKFDKRWSDGGLRKTRDVKRIQNFDIVNHFLRNLKKGSRNFCLVHPQRWGYNVDIHQNPMMAKEQWYQEICASSQLEHQGAVR